VATCPAGHDSAEDDFCDVCGVLIGAAPSLVSQPPSGEDRNTGISGAGMSSAGGVLDGQAGEPCPRCGTPRGGQFCEGCGYDFKAAPDPAVPSPAPTVNASPPWGTAPVGAGPAAVGAGPAGGPPPPAATRWTAVVTADRAYYESVQADGAPDASAIGFPAYCPQRKFQLSGAEVRIGRRSARSGIDPEIDLTGPPTDPGVSRLHAVLLRGQDDAWAVLDPGSANGTLVNGTEIPRDEAVPVRAGDRIHLGAWTVISILRED
jgi:FHA domain